jgi:phage major head subunit gpT-like protein
MLVNLENVQMLHNAYSAAYQTGLAKADVSFQDVTTIVPSNNKSNYYAWLGDMGDVREWLGDRVVEEMAGHDYTVKNKDWEKTIAVDRNDIADDSYGLYTPMMEDMGFVSRTHRSRLMWQLFMAGETGLCYDGKAFFAEDHQTDDGPVQSNLTTGAESPWYLIDNNRPLRPMIFQLRQEMEFTAMTDATTENVFLKKKFIWGVNARYNGGYGFWQTAHKAKVALTEANLDAVRVKMSLLKDAKSMLLAINPTLLVVGPSNRLKAEKLVVSLTAANGETNAMRGSFKVLVVPYLG